MSIGADTSLRDVAFEVCTVLDRIGTTAVLSGGAAATLYAPEAIQSFDLDFVLTVYGTSSRAAGALETLGFSLQGQHYEHASNPFLLEFPPGPLAIGDKLITRWTTLREQDRVLHVISATDSCRDRLAAFYHFGDRSALDQALAVQHAQASSVDLDVVRKWSEREGHAERCAEFMAGVKAGA